MDVDVSGVDVEEIDRGDGKRLTKLGFISLNCTEIEQLYLKNLS